MATSQEKQMDVTYLDVQAAVGITKHMGGFRATDALLALCRVDTAREVLYVGCGIGVGPAYIARKYACRVVGVDISEQMVAWSRQRAREEKVEDRVDFKAADVLDLPFEDDRFDAVLVESVLAFVEDKARALSECVRVTRPGGYTGLNETVWQVPPSPEIAGLARALVGPVEIPQVETWQSLWANSGLEERTISCHSIQGRSEVRDRLEWVGWRWALRGFYRLTRLYLGSPAARRSIKEQLRSPKQSIDSFGYMLLSGRKP